MKYVTLVFDGLLRPESLTLHHVHASFQELPAHWFIRQTGGQWSLGGNDPLKTWTWRFSLQRVRELLWSTEACGLCGLETSLLSAVTPLPTAIKDVNEKGRLTDVGRPSPFPSFSSPLLVVVRGRLVLRDPVGADVLTDSWIFKPFTFF